MPDGWSSHGMGDLEDRGDYVRHTKNISTKQRLYLTI